MKKEEFFDEQIIDMINQTENKREMPNVEVENKEGNSVGERKDTGTTSLEDGIKIMGKTICFERRMLADDTVTMMVPTEFTVMSEEVAIRKYPSSYRPKMILTDYSGTVNLMFNYMQRDDENTSVELLRNQVFGMMKRFNPGIKEREIGMLNVGPNEIAYVEFTNNTMDGKLYNLMFYLDVNGKPLMGSFNCTTKEMKYWREPAFDMVRSIEIPVVNK